MTIQILIVTAAEWAPERRPGLARLQAQLPGAITLASPVREHASVWALRAWRKAAAHDGPTVILNDDVTVCPDFPAVVAAMLAAVPDQVIALHTTIAIAPSLAACGERWVRSYWLTGPGYVFPPGAAARLHRLRHLLRDRQPGRARPGGGKLRAFAPARSRGPCRNARRRDARAGPGVRRSGRRLE